MHLLQIILPLVGLTTFISALPFPQNISPGSANTNIPLADGASAPLVQGSSELLDPSIDPVSQDTALPPPSAGFAGLPDGEIIQPRLSQAGASNGGLMAPTVRDNPRVIASSGQGNQGYTSSGQGSQGIPSSEQGAQGIPSSGQQNQGIPPSMQQNQVAPPGQVSPGSSTATGQSPPPGQLGSLGDATARLVGKIPTPGFKAKYDQGRSADPTGQSQALNLNQPGNGGGVPGQTQAYNPSQPGAVVKPQTEGGNPLLLPTNLGQFGETQAPPGGTNQASGTTTPNTGAGGANGLPPAQPGNVALNNAAG